MRPAADTSRWVSGVLQLVDTVPNSDPSYFTYTLTVDFRRLLGRDLSCLGQRPSLIEVRLTADTMELGLPAGVADCGLGARALRRGAAFHGTWLEDSFGGPRAIGRFEMCREPTKGAAAG